MSPAHDCRYQKQTYGRDYEQTQAVLTLRSHSALPPDGGGRIQGNVRHEVREARVDSCEGLGMGIHALLGVSLSPPSVHLALDTFCFLPRPVYDVLESRSDERWKARTNRRL